MSERRDSSVTEHAPERGASGKWLKGQTGNRGGRPRGQTWHQKVRREIQANTPAVLARLLDLAMASNTDAARLILSRSLAPARDDPVRLHATGTLDDQARGIVAQVAAGTIAPSVGVELLNALAIAGRIAELGELEQRIQAIEAAQALQAANP
jgi:hypothetical protein